jgi:hypothetical protein
MTLGVAGIMFGDGRDIAKGGNEGIRIAPVNSRPISATRRSQLVEWRCLSFREARILVTEGKDRVKAIGSSGTKGAEQKCTALLGKEMVPLCAVQVAHGFWI